MKKGQIEKNEKGFSIKPTQEYIDKKEREKRIKERKDVDKTKVTNAEIFKFLQDTNDRLSEIYDMLKEK